MPANGSGCMLCPWAKRARLLVLVSKFDHCLNDLLYRWRTGALAVDIVGIVSNHSDLAPLAEWHGLPFHHLPLANPAEVLRWNSDKAYLARLADQGVPIPPTRWTDRVTQDQVDAAFAETGAPASGYTPLLWRDRPGLVQAWLRLRKM